MEAPRHELAEATRGVQRAAAAGDADALHDALCQLRNALVDHLAARRGDDVADRVAHDGQQRLLRFVDELLVTTEEGPETCTCMVRSAELRSMLARQLRLEASVVRRRSGNDRQR